MTGARIMLFRSFFMLLLISISTYLRTYTPIVNFLLSAFHHYDEQMTAPSKP